MTVFLIIVFWLWGIGAVKYHYSDTYYRVSDILVPCIVIGCVVLIVGLLIMGVLNGYIE